MNGAFRMSIPSSCTLALRFSILSEGIAPDDEENAIIFVLRSPQRSHGLEDGEVGTNGQKARARGTPHQPISLVDLMKSYPCVRERLEPLRAVSLFCHSDVNF